MYDDLCFSNTELLLTIYCLNRKSSVPEVYIKTEESDADSGNIDELNPAASSSTEVKEYLYVHQQNPLNNNSNKKQRYGDPLCEASMTSFDNNIELTNAHSSYGAQRNSIHDDDDYDRMFLLSLLPSLRQIPDNIKLQTRIQMQQVLVTALQSNDIVNKS